MRQARLFRAGATTGTATAGRAEAQVRIRVSGVASNATRDRLAASTIDEPSNNLNSLGYFGDDFTTAARATAANIMSPM